MAEHERGQPEQATLVLHWHPDNWCPRMALKTVNQVEIGDFRYQILFSIEMNMDIV